MERRIPFPLAALAPLLVLVPLLASCAGKAPGKPGSIWPPQADPGRVWYAARFMSSPDTALRALRDTRASWTVLGGEPVEIASTQGRLRVRVQIKKTRKEAVYHASPFRRGCLNPASVTCDDYPDFVERTTFERPTLILPLPEVERVLLYEPDIVRVVHEKGRITDFSARDGETRQLLADALSTLARPFGFRPEASPGMTLADLTLAQRLNLGLSGGVLVTGVERGGPAERAGLHHLDVILKLDGEAADAVKLTARAASLTDAEAAPLHLDVLRWRADPDDPLDKTGPFSTELRSPRDIY